MKQSILTPDKANAIFLASISVAMNDQHPDYASLLLGNYILGGSIDSSRLANRIRQREGLSYGVSSFFFVRANDKWAMLSMTASCNPSNIEKVETAVREELERLLRDGIPIGEFETAKEALLKSRKLEQNNDIRISSRLRRSLLVNQTLSYDTEIDSKLATLTPGEVQNALRMHFDLERLIVVTAGDFAKERN